MKTSEGLIGKLMRVTVLFNNKTDLSTSTAFVSAGCYLVPNERRDSSRVLTTEDSHAAEFPIMNC